MPKAAKSAAAPKAAAPAKSKSAEAREDVSIEAALGSQVRHLRSQLGITASELAHEAGLSASALSKIENGQISPSLATLQALSRALHVPVSALFSQFEESRDCSYVAAGEGMRLERRGTRAGHEYQLLGHPLSGPVTVEPYLIRLAQDSQAYTSFRHAGLEFIYMLTGRVRYRHGDRSFVLNPGDSLFFDSASSHGPEEIGKSPCSYLSIIISPKQA